MDPGQIIATSKTTEWPPKGSFLEGKSHYFISFQENLGYGELLEFGQNDKLKNFVVVEVQC